MSVEALLYTARTCDITACTNGVGPTHTSPLAAVRFSHVRGGVPRWLQLVLPRCVCETAAQVNTVRHYTTPPPQLTHLNGVVPFGSCSSHSGEQVLVQCHRPPLDLKKPAAERKGIRSVPVCKVGVATGCVVVMMIQESKYMKDAGLARQRQGRAPSIT